MSTGDGEIVAVAIHAQTTAIVGMLTLLNATIERNFGPMGANEFGSTAQSLAAIKEALLHMCLELADMKAKQGELTTHVHGLSSSVDALNVTQATMTTYHLTGMMARMQTDSFNKQATLDALDRSGYEHPKPPTIHATLEDIVRDMGRVITALETSVSTIITGVVNRIKDFIMTSAPVKYLQEVFDAVDSKLRALASAFTIKVPTVNDTIESGTLEQISKAPTTVNIVNRITGEIVKVEST